MSELYPSLYIKPTRKKHESNYRIFEVGYAIPTDNGFDYVPVATSSDVICPMVGYGMERLGMDTYDYNYIMLWTKEPGQKLVWVFVWDSAQFESIPVDQEDKMLAAVLERREENG